MLIFILFLTYISGQVHLIIHWYPLLEKQFAGAWFGAGMGVGIPARSPWNDCPVFLRKLTPFHQEAGDTGWCAASWITSGNLLSQPCVLVNREGLTFNPPTTICFIIYLRESESFCSFTKVPDTKIFLIAEIFHSCHYSFWKYRYFHTTRS